MLRPAGEKCQPAAQDGHCAGDCVGSLGPAEPGGPAEQAGEGDTSRVRQQELRRTSEADPGILAVVPAHRLLGGEEALDVAEDDGGEFGGEGEALVAVTGFG